MKNESIIAIISLVAILSITALAFVTLLAIFCYKQENVRFLGKHKSKADISGTVEIETELDYDSTHQRESDKNPNFHNKYKKENDR